MCRLNRVIAQRAKEFLLLLHLNLAENLQFKDSRSSDVSRTPSPSLHGSAFIETWDHIQLMTCKTKASFSSELTSKSGLADKQNRVVLDHRMILIFRWLSLSSALCCNNSLSVKTACFSVESHIQRTVPQKFPLINMIISVKLLTTYVTYQPHIIYLSRLHISLDRWM